MRKLLATPNHISRTTHHASRYLRGAWCVVRETQESAL